MSDDPTTARPMLLVGYSGAVLSYLSSHYPDLSLIFVDEPDVLRKRNVYQATAGAAGLRELIEWEYLRAGAADCFFHRYRDLELSGVVPIIEFGVPFAARLAERYGLVGAGYGAGLALRDKRLQRVVTAAAGIANPRSQEVTGPEQVREFLAELGGPAVLKPANQSGSIGTRILSGPAEAEAAWAECLQEDPGDLLPDRPGSIPLRMLVEEFIQGDEYSVEMLVRHGRCGFGAVTQKFLYPGARPVEQGHLHPADIEPALSERLLAATERAVQAVGMDCGFVHCEWLVRDGTPYLVECAGRMAGDGIIELVDLTWDYDVVGEFYGMMQGRPPGDLPPAKAYRSAVAWTSAAPSVGVIESVRGVAEAEAVPGVQTVVAHEPGKLAQPLLGSGDRLTLVTAVGETPAAALANARQAVGLIEFTVRPHGPA